MSQFYHTIRYDRRIFVTKDFFYFSTDIQREDNGVYKCTAQSDSGSSSASANLQVVSSSSASARTTPAPRPNDIPGAPRPPKLRARNDTTITIAWGPPQQEGASPITNYIIEVRHKIRHFDS